jgi:hypothetical protein
MSILKKSLRLMMMMIFFLMGGAFTFSQLIPKYLGLRENDFFQLHFFHQMSHGLSPV